MAFDRIGRAFAWPVLIGLAFTLGACSGAASPPASQRPASSGSSASLAENPTGTPPPSEATPSPTPRACQEEQGRIEVHSLRSDLLKLPFDFRVYTPPCYQAETQRRYPVLYLIHGQSFNDDQWDRLGADELADELIAAGELSPFLIVMPRDRVWTQPTEDPFGQALVEELIPWIDENYRTLPQRQYRAVGGLSRGASWAVHLGLKHWELFGAVGAHSLPVFWADSPYVSHWLDAIPPEQTPRFYLDVATHDQQAIRESAAWFEGLLRERRIPHEWYLFNGYHDEGYWGGHLEQYLRWYAQDW